MTTDPLREALNDVVTKSTWRPDNTVLIHDGSAWNTLVGRIVMATNGDDQARAALASQPEPLDTAWTAAEAALPEDQPWWELSVEGKTGHFATATAHNLRDATAFVTESSMESPAAALLALAARLSEEPR